MLQTWQVWNLAVKRLHDFVSADGIWGILFLRSSMWRLSIICHCVCVDVVVPTVPWHLQLQFLSPWRWQVVDGHPYSPGSRNRLRRCQLVPSKVRPPTYSCFHWQWHITIL